MKFVPKPLRYIIVTATLFLIGYCSYAQDICETGYFSDYSTNGHLFPSTITTLHNGHQVVAGQLSPSAVGREQGMVARLSETGDVIWSKTIVAGSASRFDGILEKADGKYIIYGTLFSPGDTDGRIWLLCLDQVGNMQWSRVIEKVQPGPVKLYSLLELPGGEIVGTYNIADSSTSSRPVVFRLQDNGTIRWAREYAQNEAVGFNSLSFANGTIYAAGFQKVGRKKAIIMLVDASSGDIIERRYPAYYNKGADQEAKFIQVFNNRISYTIDYTETVDQIVLSATVFVQTSLDNVTVFGAQKTGLTEYGAQVRIKRTPYNDFMIMRNWSQQSQMINHSQFGAINWSRSLIRYAHAEVVTGFDTANGGGGVSVGHYTSFPDPLRHMKIVKLTSKGNGGTCTEYGYTFHSDTINLVQENFNWSGMPANIALDVQSTGPVSITPFVLQKNEQCHTSECRDLAPLQPGCNKTMMVEYATPNRSQLSDVVSLGDGSRIAVGHNGYFPWAVKLKENGDVEWSRFYNQHHYGGELKKVIRLSSSTILIAGNVSATVNHGSSRSGYLLKIDNDGNILASQTFYSYGSSDVGDLVPTDDGGFILVEVGVYGFPPIYNFVTRFNADMQVVWKKRLDVFAVDPISRNVYVNNGKIYIGHDYYPQSWMDHVGIVKMDLASGNLEWAKIFELPSDNFPLRFNRIIAVKDTVYGFVNQLRSDGTGLLMLRIDQQGKYIDAKDVGGFNMVQTFAYSQWDISRPTVTLTPDLDFVTANLVKTPAGQALNLSRFTHAGQKVWSHNYTTYNNHTVFNIRPHALGFQMVGRVAWVAGQLDYNFTNSFFLKTDSVGKLTLAPTGDCAPVDVEFNSRLVDVNSFSDTRGVQSVSDNDWIKIQLADVFAYAAPVDATLSCHRQSDCSPVTLGMMGDLCKLNQPVTFYLQNNNCGSLAKWKFDPNYFDELIRKPDTLTVMPKRSGASQILAEVENDCTSRELSIPISIAVLAASLELGRDTVLCSNKSLTLKAGEGFKSYAWNDGSTNSELQVTSPGKYFVRVQDFCGNEGSDTLLVSDPGDWFTVTGPLNKCNGDSIDLAVPNTFSQVAWSPGNILQANGHTAKVFPSQTSKIFVQAEWLPGCVVKDTVEINVLHSPSINLEKVINICYNDTIALTAPTGFSSYSWSTGEPGKQISVHDAGTYSVSALYSNGCYSRDTIIVQKPAFVFPKLGPDKSICRNEADTLNPGSYSEYRWSTGATTSQLVIHEQGFYSVTVTDKFGCKASDTMQVLAILEAPGNYLPGVYEFCPGQDILIVPSGTFSTYNWSTGSSNATIRVKDTGQYVLKVVGFNGCAGTDSVRGRYKADCPQTIHFPNAFTPNGDGLNDSFAPVINGMVTNYRFEIYNRWGERVYASSTPNEGWDGRIKGIVQSNGGYVWKCSYQFPGKGVQKQVGTVLLLR